MSTAPCVISPVLAQHYNVMTLNPQELVDILRKNVGDTLSRLDLETVRVPTAGGLTWTIPEVEGERTEKTLRGIVVYQTVTRGYWAETFDTSGGGTPRTCTSNDGKKGVGNPGGTCATCPLNQWGSDRRGGNGKACREMRQIFMRNEDRILPFVVVAPPTSVRPAREYFTRLTARAIPFYGAMTEIALAQEKSRGGITYSKAAFRLAGRLSPAQTAHMKSYLEALTPALSGVWAEAEEVAMASWTLGDA